MLADRGMTWNFRLVVVDLGKLCGIPVYTRWIPIQSHLLRNLKNYRGRGLLALSCSRNTRDLKLMINSSVSAIMQHFYDKSWFFVTESMLALTFFR